MFKFATALNARAAGLALALSGMALTSAPLASAQKAMAGHVMETRDEIPPAQLPPPEKLSGIGNVHIRITASPEARVWFDQGLNLLHDFWDYESLRAFEQSVRVDPQCAMCYWGIYQAESFRRSAAKHYADEALAKAVSLKSHAGKTERLYIEATAAHEAADKAAKGSDSADYSEEIRLWRKLVKRAPHDTQARIYLAETVMDGYDDAGEPRSGQKEGLAILQSVLRDEPDNSAANHYWIHAVEASAHPEQALHSAEILGGLAPSSGHMVHMPGHIFYRVGDYARAEQAFSASERADESYMQAQHVGVDDDWNYVHNLMYAIANLMEEGRLEEATTLSAKLKSARGELETTLYPWSPRDGIARLDPRLPVALRTADWARALDLLGQSSPPATLPNLIFLKSQLTDFASGMHAVEARDLAKAQEASTRLDADLWRMSQDLKDQAAGKTKKDDTTSKGAPKMTVMPDAQAKPLVSNLSIMSLELRAAILAAKNQTVEAKKLFAQAAEQEKNLGYREPPGYIRPVAETEAASLLAASDWLGATEAYKSALVERPRSGFPLYGLALSSERAGDASAAASQYADFISAWKNADSDLSELAHAQAFLAQHQGAVAQK